MKEGDILHCIKKCCNRDFNYYEYERVEINVGEMCILNKIYNVNVIISNKDSSILLPLGKIEEYFETLHEHRRRIIEDLI